jgi:hypothetical protein
MYLHNWAQNEHALVLFINLRNNEKNKTCVTQSKAIFWDQYMIKYLFVKTS